MEVMTVGLAGWEELVIHAVPMRDKYRKRYQGLER